MKFIQQHRVISLETPLGPDALLLQSFTGTEGISRLFRFNLDLLSEESSIDFDSVIGQPAAIHVELADGTPRYFNGYVSKFVQSAQDERFTRYQAELVPWLWFLTLNADCRIFQNMTVPDIITQVFDEHGFADYRNSLVGNYDEREFCVQYRESDFNFVSRLMEQYGIFYFFEHAQNKHVLVLGDNASVYQPCPNQSKARFQLVGGSVEEEDLVTAWDIEQELRTGSYSLEDYNFRDPRTNLLSTEPTIVTVNKNGGYELYDYPGEYETKSQGQSLAKLRMQEEETPCHAASGASCCRAFSSGFRFDLTDFYRNDVNRSYVLTEVQHIASMGATYGSGRPAAPPYYNNQFKCIPYGTEFRAPRITAKPIIPGPQTALVVGKEGQEIWVDGFARVKVQFYWDRLGHRDENSSCWIRVSQPWAGNGWGSMWIPRMGQEVIVEFLEGDPDRPIITGRVYNADNMPYYQLPAYQTLSYFKSSSSLGGKGFNEIRFEDKKDKEQVFMHSQKRMDVRVKGSYYDTCHGNRETVVGWENETDSGGDYNLLVEGNHSIHVKKGVYQNVDEKLNLTIKDDVVCDFQNNQSTMVSNKYELNAQQIIIEASQQISLKVGGNFVVIDPTGVTIYGTVVNINSGGSGVETGEPDITDALDAYTSDNGEPGYLEKISKYGGKGRTWHHRTLHSQHCVAAPSPSGGSAVSPGGTPLPPAVVPGVTPAEKVKGTPVVIPPTLNSIVCKAGNLVVQNNNSGPDRSCTQAHEGSHIQDWKDRYGETLCQGVPDGSLPVGGAGYEEFLRQSECKAYKVGKTCRNNLLEKAAETDKPAIQKAIDRDNDQIKKNKCD